MKRQRIWPCEILAMVIIWQYIIYMYICNIYVHIYICFPTSLCIVTVSISLASPSKQLEDVPNYFWQSIGVKIE